MIRMFKALSKVLLEGVGYSSEASQLLVAIISRL